MIHYQRPITATLPLRGSEAHRQGGLHPCPVKRLTSTEIVGNAVRKKRSYNKRKADLFWEAPSPSPRPRPSREEGAIVPESMDAQSSLRPLCLIASLLMFVVMTVLPPGPLLADDSPESLAGFSASETYDIVPGSPLELEENFFVRSLYRIAKVSSESLGKFSQDNDDISWQQLLEKTRDFRFWAFTRDATLERLTILKFPEKSEAGINGVYLAACRSDDGHRFFLVCRSVPSRLPRDEQLNEPIRFSGFFYNSVRLGAGGESLELGRADPRNEDGEEPEEIDMSNVAPMFVVNRFAWYPQTPTEVDGKASVSSGHVELASQGVDVGLFDYVRKRNSKPLAQQDAGCFYQMLQAASAIGRDGQDEPQQVNKQSSSPVEFVQLVGAPKKHIGARVRVTGSLRQCVRIEVPADAPTSGGQPLQHYYQVSLFPDLGGRKVVTRTEQGEDLSFDRYPVTVCLSTLPAGTTPEALAGKTATVDGFFYRLIKYQSQKTEAEGKDGMVSPLVMASGIQLVSTAKAARAIDNLMNIFLWLMLAAIAAAIVWKFLSWRRSVFGGTRRGDEGAFDFPDKIDASNIEDQNLSL